MVNFNTEFPYEKHQLFDFQTFSQNLRVLKKYSEDYQKYLRQNYNIYSNSSNNSKYYHQNRAHLNFGGGGNANNGFGPIP